MGRLQRKTKQRIRIAIVVLLLGAGVFWSLRLLRQHRISTRLEDHFPVIRKYSNQHRLPFDFVVSVVRAESGGNPLAVSKANAKGLMQLRSIAEKDVLQKTGWNKGDLFDPDYNVRVGTRYLRILADRFGGDPWLVLAAYNMGPGNVAKLRRKYPRLSSRQLIQRHAYKETKAYCRKILSNKTFRIN